MQPLIKLDRAKAETIIESARDDDWAWESPESSQALAVWDWAELNGLVDIQAGIAHACTTVLMLRDRGKGMRVWFNKLMALAEAAKKDGRVRDYAGFIEGALPIGAMTWTEAAPRHEELYQIYLQIDDWAYAIRQAYLAAHARMGNGELRSAAELLLSAYRSSRQHDYPLGVVWAFLGMRDLLAPKDSVLAYRLLHQAKLISLDIPSKFGITATDKMRSPYFDQISRSELELNSTPDELAAEFEGRLEQIL